MSDDNNYVLNPMTWFGERELSYLPPHFTMATTPLNTKKREWILNKLSGRFCVITRQSFEDDVPVNIWDIQSIPAFEDPNEVTFYELTWS